MLKVMPTLAVASYSDSHDHYLRFIVVGSALVVVVGFLVYRAVKRRMDRRRMLLTFRTTVPVGSEGDSLSLGYSHIELLAEMTKPRSENYLMLARQKWEERLGYPLSVALEDLRRAKLTKRARTKDEKSVITGRGAALIVQNSQSSKARSAAMRRL
jgi:hypothetical protein